MRQSASLTAGSRDERVKPQDIIQIAPPHKWGGCLAVVSELKSFGVQAYVSIPHNNGTPPGRAYIRLTWDEFEPLGAAVVFVPADEQISDHQNAPTDDTTGQRSGLSP